MNRRALLVLVSAAALLSLAGCATNPNLAGLSSGITPLLLVAWLFVASAVTMLTGCGGDNAAGFPPNTFTGTTGSATTTSSTTTTGSQQQIPVQLAFQTQPGSKAANATAPGEATEALPAFTVAIEDASGNVVTAATGIPVTVALGSGSPSAKLSGTLTVNSINGIATFSNVIVSFAGSFTLTASAPGLSSATSSAFNVAPLALSFPTHENFPSDCDGVGVAFGDFNGDKIQDVAIFSYYAYGSSNGTIRVMLGNGDGTFKPPVVSPLPAGISLPAHKGIAGHNIAAADFNGDGRTDLAFSSYYSTSSSGGGGVFVGLANPDGSLTFGAKSIVGKVFDTSNVAVGHFDGDAAHFDLAFTSYSSTKSTYQIELGKVKVNGSTVSFSGESTVASPLPSILVAGDFNGDGKTDLADVYSNGTASIAILVGDGTGKLTVSPNIANLTGRPTAVGIGKINGDSADDLLIGEYSKTGYPIQVALGGSQGGHAAFTLQNPGFTLPSFARSIAVAPFGGDSNMDAAVALTTGKYLSNSPSSRPLLFSVQTAKGNGDGTFQASVNQSPVGLIVSGIDAADVNGDGITDVLAVTADPKLHPNTGVQHTVPYLNTEVQVLLGKSGSVALSGPPAALPVNGATFRTAIADVNGDGSPDLIALSITPSHSKGQPAVSTLSVFLNSQGPAVTTTLGNIEGLSFAVGDVNGDGRADVVVGDDTVGADQVSVWLGQTDGTFLQGASVLTGNQPLGIALTDLNGDGHLDLVAAAFSSATNNAPLTIALGNGDGSFATPISINTGLTRPSLATADFNGDGRPDIIVLGTNGSNGYLETFLNNGNGGFPTSPSSVQTLPSKHIGSKYGIFGSATAVADFDNDGKQDVVFIAAINDPVGSLYLAHGNGDGSFAAPIRVGACEFFGGVRTADMNNDGIPDLVVNQLLDNDVLILTGNGDGTFAPGVGFGTNSIYALDVAIGDVNGDGRLDLVTASLEEYISSLNGSTPQITSGLTVLPHNP